MKHNIILFSNVDSLCRTLVSKLSQQGHSITLYTRRATRYLDLQVLTGVVIREILGNRPNDFEEMMQGHDTVINLLTSIDKPAGSNYQEYHVATAQKIVRSAEKSGISRLLYLSAYHAHPALGENEFLRSKGEAESVLHSSGLSATTFRPSLIIGNGDPFTAQMVFWLKHYGGSIPMAKQVCYPIHVEDVADAFIHSIDDYNTFGNRYNLVGTRAYSFLQFAELVHKALHLNTPQPKPALMLNTSGMYGLFSLTPWVSYITPTVLHILKVQHKNTATDRNEKDNSQLADTFTPRSIASALCHNFFDTDIREHYHLCRQTANRDSLA